MGTMRVLEAHVKGGQPVLDEPVGLPEGSEVQVALVDGDEFDDLSGPSWRAIEKFEASMKGRA
jgi:hypothetical protein